MKKLKNLFLILIISIIIQICLIQTVCLQSRSQKPSMISWLNYQKNNKMFTLQNPINKVRIQFPDIKQQNIIADSISISKNNFWRGFYKDLGDNKVTVISKGQAAWIHYFNIDRNNKFSVILPKGNNGKNISILFQKQLLGKVPDLCQSQKTTPNRFNCQFDTYFRIYILFQTDPADLAFFQSKQYIQDHQNVIPNFITQMNIKNQSTPQNSIYAFTRQMITNTLNSICKQDSQYQGYHFYGLCSNQNKKQIDLHYSLLVVDILFKYNSGLALWLVENYIDLLEEKLFYSFSGREWIPIPEHIQVFLTYLKVITTENNPDQDHDLRQKINKVIIIQNGLLNNLLLSQVNHLNQQMNYREQNKIHPTILKMLNQAWKTDLPRARVSSIYSQSFTNDFFYHQKNQKIDKSVGKTIWLIKLINQHIKVIKKYGDSFQRQSSLQQLLSLKKVMERFVLEEPNAQSGKFNSIIITQKIRVYTRSIGYQSLLPYSYELSQVFPTNSIMNLTTQLGLASLNLDNPKYAQSYNFRGNINLYFNYKILFGMMKQSLNNPKNKPFATGIKTIIQSIQDNILKIYSQNKQSEKPIFYTSLTPKGKGVASQNYLSLVNVAFLRNLQAQKITNQKKTSQKVK